MVIRPAQHTCAGLVPVTVSQPPHSASTRRATLPNPDASDMTSVTSWMELVIAQAAACSRRPSKQPVHAE